MNQTHLSARKRRMYPLFAVLLTAIVAGFTYYHIETYAVFWTVPIIIILFIYMLWMILSAHLNHIFDSDTDTENLKPIVVMPIYNEDPDMLKISLDSIISQSKKPLKVYLIDDCSTSDDYGRIINSFKKNCKKQGIQIEFHRQETNRGKRQAQAIAFAKHRNDREVIFITMDSDTVLDKEAIKKGLYPFSDGEIMSSAGMLHAYNRTNILTKIISLPFASSFLNGRSAWSAYNSVAVSCGGLAFYRSRVIDEFLEEYTNQIVFGEPARYGDDRMMTEYASLLGKTVFQETSIGFTLVPENISHLTRQRLRWWRSFWWGGFWVLKTHRPNRMIWWLILSQYVTAFAYIVVFIAVAVVYPLVHGHFPWLMIVYLMLLSYVRSMRTLSMKRSDVSTMRQIIEFIIISPLSSLLNIYVDTILRFVALATLKEKGWGTRNKVEVTAHSKKTS